MDKRARFRGGLVTCWKTAVLQGDAKCLGLSLEEALGVALSEKPGRENFFGSLTGRMTKRTITMISHGCPTATFWFLHGNSSQLLMPPMSGERALR